MKALLRLVAYIVLSVIGMFGICGLFGEPTAEYWSWMHSTFGAFSVVWFLAEKAFWVCILAGVYHLWPRAAFVSTESIGKEEAI